MLRLTIAKKLMLLVAISLLGFLISQSYSQWIERTNSERLSDVEERLYPRLDMTTGNLASLLLMEQVINSAVTTGDETPLEQAEVHYQDIRNNLQKLAALNETKTARLQATDKLLQDWYNTATRIARSFIGSDVDFEKIGTEAAAMMK